MKTWNLRKKVNLNKKALYSEGKGTEQYHNSLNSIRNKPTGFLPALKVNKSDLMLKAIDREMQQHRNRSYDSINPYPSSPSKATVKFKSRFSPIPSRATNKARNEARHNQLSEHIFRTYEKPRELKARLPPISIKQEMNVNERQRELLLDKLKRPSV